MGSSWPEVKLWVIATQTGTGRYNAAMVKTCRYVDMTRWTTRLSNRKNTCDCNSCSTNCNFNVFHPNLVKEYHIARKQLTILIDIDYARRCWRCPFKRVTCSNKHPLICSCFWAFVLYNFSTRWITHECNSALFQFILGLHRPNHTCCILFTFGWHVSKHVLFW